jgi:hypothetical protein
MAMHLENIVPFGRSLDEYIHMFTLTEEDFSRSILSVGDGPASFNAEGTKLGYQIKSIDPLYIFTADQIRARFNAVIDNIIDQITNTADDWVWTYHKSPAALRTHREQVMDLFAADYAAGKASNRYEVGEMPTLKYSDSAYNLGLSSHFLFLYSDHLDQQFHLDSIIEMLRVCQEVRIFPLLTLMLQTSPYLQPIITQLQNIGFNCEIQQVNYELQPGGNQMLKITRNTI